MHLILEEFGPNIQHIPRVDNIVADTLSCLTLANNEREDPSTRQGQLCANNLFAINAQNPDESFQLRLSLVREEQQKELNKPNSTIKTNLEDTTYGYNKQDLDDINIIFYKNRIHVPAALVDIHWTGPILT